MSSGIPAISTEITPSLLRGFVELDTTEHGLLPHRLPAWARAQYSDPQLTMVEEQPSGVHFKFKTAATLTDRLHLSTEAHDLIGRRFSAEVWRMAILATVSARRMRIQLDSTRPFVAAHT
jgi:hypothetical protein